MHKILSKIKLLFLKIKGRLDRLFERDFKFKFDGLKTRNNMSFVNEESFKKAYKRALISSDDLDFKIPMRVHQALWCASNCKDIEGDVVELGTGKGFIFSAIMEILSKDLDHKDIFLVDTFLPYKTDQSTEVKIRPKIKAIYMPTA